MCRCCLNFSYPLIIVTMKAAFAVTFAAVAQAGEANHIEKIIQQIIGEGEAVQTECEEFFEWCLDTSKNFMLEIKRPL